MSSRPGGLGRAVSHLQSPPERNRNAYEDETAPLSPGQWARVLVPDYECWQKNQAGYCRTKPGDEVDICVMPIYMPRYDSTTYFHWNYRVAYRSPGSAWPNYESPRGCWITPWDFGLIDPTTSSPNWDKQTSDDHHAGKGKWLYEPASDDPDAVPWR